MSLATFINKLFISCVILMPALTRLFDMTVVTNYHLDIALFIVSFFLSSRNRLYTRYYMILPFLIWGIWEIYSLMNWTIIGIRPNGVHMITFYWRLLQVYFMAVVIAYEGSKDLMGTVKWIIYTFLIYILMGLTMQGNASAELEGSWAERGGGVLKNKLPLTACALTFVAFYSHIQRVISKKSFFILFALACYTIIWVATRKAMLSMFIFGIFYSLTQIDYNNTKERLKIISSIIVLYAGYWYVMNFTQIGARVAEMDEFDFDVAVPEYLFFLGDRAIQYVMGFDLFLEYPINGIGIFNFMDVTQFPYPLHTEYMTQLCEGGIIGAFLYILFILTMIRYSINTYKYYSKHMGLVCYSGLGFILFVSLTTWAYDGVYYWVVYGLMVAYWVKSKVLKL